MGAVYRATDTKLNRDVAIKVLPDAFSADPDRLARFTREAQVLAALNHPNIAAIYGVEDRALVMELVEGENLKCPVSVDTALGYAKQIAEALEAAHEKGIVHRDLKPANIKVTPQGAIKVLDFGLAAVAQGSPAASGNPQTSPTLTMMGATQVGLILGTASYMSPEQAAGKPVDRRADIWSFGVVLWEMLTGKRLFEGETVSHTLASVLQGPINFDSLPKETPASVKTLLKRCLDRNVRNRLRDIGEARVALENAGQAPEAPAPRSRGILPWAIAAALAVIAAGLGYVAFRHSQEEAPRVAKLTVLPPEKGQFVVTGDVGPPAVGPPAVSPDGRHIVAIASVDGKTGLWIRELDSPTPRLLAGTEGAISPFWSPDSRYLGFGADGKLKKIDIIGGPPVTICDAPNLRGGTWNKNDVIVFNPTNFASGLFRVSAAGGTPTPVTELDESRNENSHRFPWFLRDGRHFLYMGRSREPEKTGVFVGDLESPAGKQARKQVVSGDTTAAYATATGSPGYLLFMRNQTLMAQPFNAEKLASTGEAIPVAEQVYHGITQYGAFGVSQTGVLAYVAGGASGGVQLTWFDRSGRPSGTVGPPGVIQWASLSPDGNTVATDRVDPQSGLSDLWLHDLARNTDSRLNFGGNARFPTWSPDGARITFQATAKNGNNIFVRNANQTGQEEVLGDSPSQRPTDWSRDGRYIIAEQGGTTGGIWVHPLFGDKKPFAYGHPGFRENEAKLSPTGKWLAYWSNESNRRETYVMSFPTPEVKVPISTAGGRIPVWSRDGRELYFISDNNKMMMVKINTAGGKFQASVPQPLFDVRMLGGIAPNFDVSKDGRFLIPTVLGEVSNLPMTVVLNWQAGLKK
jgi:Tol biopolymer transport system component